MGPWQGDVTIVERQELTSDYVRLTCAGPEIAAAARPGLFCNILVPAPELCLRRPISFHATAGETFTMLVGVHGEGTRYLAACQVGDRLDVIGPLGGRGLSVEPGAEQIVLVGGGVGIPPLHHLASELVTGGNAPATTMVIGARTADRLLCVEDFERLGVAVVTATDDGSAGFAGTAVAALAEHLSHNECQQVLCCGPTPMMRGAAEFALDRSIPVQVCLEARMACAVGACLSCVVETRQPGWRKYQRVCTEGPVFDGGELVWERLSPLCAL